MDDLVLSCLFGWYIYTSLSVGDTLSFFVYPKLIYIVNCYCPVVCTNGAVRLVGGTSSNEGNLEYCHNGAWSSVCNSFHNEEATVACKQLGFSGSPSKNIILCMC